MSGQERVPNTFAPEDGAELALSMIQFTFINRDRTVCYGELFAGDPNADELEGAPEHVEWLYKLPEFHDMLEDPPNVVEVNADVYHYDLTGDYSKRRGAKTSEMARIVDDEFPNNELDLCVSGGEQRIVIYPAVGKPPKPADCPFDRYEPETAGDESGSEEDPMENEQEE